MSMTGVPLESTARAALERAADGFLPLAAWVSTKPFVPDPSAPWRNGGRLDAANLALADFFDALLRESSGDADLKTRWDVFSADPMGRCPIVDAAAWRTNRGLDPKPSFSITLSDAVLTDADVREISRAQFYAPYWALLSAAYAAADEAAVVTGAAVDEGGFALSMLADQNLFWPKATPLRPSRFAKQFIKDVLYCYLGLRGLAPHPWAEAVLVELGEGRRVGNLYGPADAVAAVTRFDEVLAAVRGLGATHPLARPGQAHFTQPVGSPPVNARDL